MKYALDNHKSVLIMTKKCKLKNNKNWGGGRNISQTHDFFFITAQKSGEKGEINFDKQFFFGGGAKKRTKNRLEIDVKTQFAN